MRRHPLARNPRFLVLALGLWMGVSGCAEPSAPDADTISREVFIQTYVDLRLSALGDPEGAITEAEKVRVLGEHGVSEDDLLAFAEIHGGDPATIQAVWDEIRSRLRQAAGEDTDTVDAPEMPREGRPR